MLSRWGAGSLYAHIYSAYYMNESWPSCTACVLEPDMEIRSHGCRIRISMSTFSDEILQSRYMHPIHDVVIKDPLEKPLCITLTIAQAPAQELAICVLMFAQKLPPTAGKNGTGTKNAASCAEPSKHAFVHSSSSHGSSVACMSFPHRAFAHLLEGPAVSNHFMIVGQDMHAIVVARMCPFVYCWGVGRRGECTV